MASPDSVQSHLHAIQTIGSSSNLELQGKEGFVAIPGKTASWLRAVGSKFGLHPKGQGVATQKFLYTTSRINQERIAQIDSHANAAIQDINQRKERENLSDNLQSLTNEQLQQRINSVTELQNQAKEVQQKTCQAYPRTYPRNYEQKLHNKKTHFDKSQKSLSDLKSKLEGQLKTNLREELQPDKVANMDDEALKTKLEMFVKACTTEDDAIFLLSVWEGLSEERLKNCFHPALDGLKPKELDAFAPLLFNVLGEKLTQFLTERISYEVSKAKEEDPERWQETIFRGKTLFTKLLEFYHQAVFQNFLKAHLQPILQDLKEQPYTYELDEKFFDEMCNRNLEENRTQIAEFSNRVLQSIVDNSSEIPEGMKIIYHTLNEKLGATFVNTTFMIRCISGALVDPQKFGMTDIKIEDDKKFQRNATLVSKNLQNVAGEVTEFHKQPFMEATAQKTNTTLLTELHTSLTS